MLSGGLRLGELLIVHDMSFIERRSADTKKYIIYLFAAIGAVIALITVVIAELSFRGWMAGIKALIRGQSLALSPEPKSRELRPIARDLEAMVRELEGERRMRDESQISWTPENLRTILREDLKGDEILIVSNREPYIHVRKDGRVEVQRPASGLVTAMEPVMRACSGTWIAHGSRQRRPRGGGCAGPRHGAAGQARLPDPAGLADQGGGGRLLLRLRQRRPVAAVPYRAHAPGLSRLRLGALPDRQPALRAGRGAGIAHREPDRAGAGLPLRPAARHDPRAPAAGDDHHLLAHPLAESRRLSASAHGAPSCWRACWEPRSSGFHTQVHCNNFFDTVDRTLEARVDRETSSIHSAANVQRCAAIRSRSSGRPRRWPRSRRCRTCRAAVRSALGLGAEVKLGVGVDRLDYTKGILERFAAVERLLELEPRLDRPLCLRADRRAFALEHRGIPEPGCAGARRGGAHQRPLRIAGLRADRAQDRAPRRATRSTRTTAPPMCASSRACTTA